MLELSVGKMWILQHGSTTYIFFFLRKDCLSRIAKSPFFRGGSFLEKLPWASEVILVQPFLHKT